MPCSEVISTLPPLVFALGADEHTMYYEIPPETYMFPFVDDYGVEEPGKCVLGVIGQSFSDIDYWILGDAFM